MKEMQFYYGSSSRQVKYKLRCMTVHFLASLPNDISDTIEWVCEELTTFHFGVYTSFLKRLVGILNMLDLIEVRLGKDDDIIEVDTGM